MGGANPPGRVVFDGFYNHRVFAMGGMYPGLNMSRALGDIVAHAEAGLSAVPDVKEIEVTPDMKQLLICTDGVWEFIDNKEVTSLTKEGAKSVDKLAKESFDRWMKDSDYEISDDITAIIIELEHF